MTIHCPALVPYCCCDSRMHTALPRVSHGIPTHSQPTTYDDEGQAGLWLLQELPNARALYSPSLGPTRLSGDYFRDEAARALSAPFITEPALISRVCLGVSLFLFLVFRLFPFPQLRWQTHLLTRPCV